MLSPVRRDPLLIGILFPALALRLAYTLQASTTPLAEVLLLDSESCDRQASSLLAGKGWTEGEELLGQVPGDEVLRARVDSLRGMADRGQR